MRRDALYAAHHINMLGAEQLNLVWRIFYRLSSSKGFNKKQFIILVNFEQIGSMRGVWSLFEALERALAIILE